LLVADVGTTSGDAIDAALGMVMVVLAEVNNIEFVVISPSSMY
jgi:hypothetical protein